MSIRTAPGKSRPGALKRTTISLPAELLEAADREVEEGNAASRTELIAEALRRELWRRQEGAIDAEIRLMAADSELLAEHKQIMEEFAQADREAFQIGERRYAGRP